MSAVLESAYRAHRAVNPKRKRITSSFRRMKKQAERSYSRLGPCRDNLCNGSGWVDVVAAEPMFGVALGGAIECTCQYEEN